MKYRLKFGGRRVKVLALVLVLAVAGAFLVRPVPAQAHCDSVNGPVVEAARGALAQGDVDLVLPYVKPEAEAELTAAFERAMAVRPAGGIAQELADTYFFETAVRLHRAGEGASYTGLKYENDFGPALAAADQALETGSIKDVSRLLEQAVSEGVDAKFQTVREARANATRLGTVEAHRERAEAELMFEKYVYELYNAATGLAGHNEAGAEHPAAVEHSAEPSAPAAAVYPIDY